MIRIFDRNTGATPFHRALAAGACALLLAACGDGGPTGPDARGGEDDFSRNTLSRYTATSDAGAPWRISGGMLVGNGLAIHGVLIREGAALESGWVETTTSHVDDGGLVVGYVDNDNYYLLGIRDDAAPFPRGSRNLAVYERVDGVFYERWDTDVTWPRGTARTLRFELVGGDHVRVLMDGELIVEGPVVPNGGTGFGLRHYGDDATWESRFDGFRWEITDTGD